MSEFLYPSFTARAMLEMEPLQIKKLHEEAKIPTRATTYSAGYDLYALEDGIIEAWNQTIIGTGIAVRFPKCEPFKVYGRIASRSGLSAKFRLETGAGVIDADYDKEIKVILYNYSSEFYSYKKHDRIAQLILELHISPDIKEVEELDVFQTDRVGGFGSTGL